MNEQATRFRIGIFFLGSMLLLAVLIILFGGFPNYFKPTHAFTVRFDNAPNIGPGAPVRRSGVRIGEVRAVALDDETGKVNIDIGVDTGYTLRKSDRPTLVAALIGGETSIDFLPPEDPRKIDNTAVPPGATLEGAVHVDTPTFLQKAGDLVQPAKDAMEDMKKVFQRFDKMAPLMEDTFKEFRELARATREVVPELRKTNAELRDFVKAANKSIPDLKRTNDEFQIAARNWAKVGERVDVLIQTNEDKFIKTLTQFEETLKRINAAFSLENQRHLTDILKNVKVSSDSLDSITRSTDELMKESRVTLKRVNDSLQKSDDVLINMQKATKPLADRSESILKNIEESTDKLNRVLGDARELLNAAARKDGTLQRLLSDPTLYRHMEDTAAQVSRLIPRLEHILRDVEIFADKIARHPESLGLGGTIRPGTGLKEPPTVLPWRPHQ